jgi:hypothetical protein
MQGYAIVNRVLKIINSHEPYMLYMSRLTVKEKQHLISGSLEFGSGFFREQLVKIAF